MTLNRAPSYWGELAKGLRGDETTYMLLLNPIMHGEAI